MTPVTRRRLAIFRAHRRGFWSLVVFTALFLVCLFAEGIANDRPLLVSYDGHLFAPVLRDYSEDAFGDDLLPTEADFTDPSLQQRIDSKGWMLWPPIRYRNETIAKDLTVPAPSPPSARHWLGTDDQARDVLARVIYGFRISVLFGFTLTLVSSVVGIAARRGAGRAGVHLGRVRGVAQAQTAAAAGPGTGDLPSGNGPVDAAGQTDHRDAHPHVRRDGSRGARTLRPGAEAVTLAELTDRLLKFRADRDWQQFHNPKDQMLSLCLEAAEVLELAQWRQGDALDAHLRENQDRLADELADVLGWVLLIASDQGIDLLAAMATKLDKNERKYPIEQAKGRADKYTAYEAE